MNVKETENQDATKANATRDNAYKLHTTKYIEHDPNKTITTSMREKGMDNYEKAHIQPVAIEFARNREHKNSAMRTFCRL